jgi:hypothetical protein
MKMITKLYSVYDSCACYYRKPFPARNVNEITRDLTNLVNDPERMESMNATDFFVFEVGMFDDSTGEVKPCKPVKICCFNDFKKGGPNKDDPANMEV